MTILLAFFLSFSAHAGFFGPSDSDEKLVHIDKIETAQAKPFEVCLRFSNASKYQVDKIDFKIVGQEEGHSTVYELSGYSDLSLDEILKPGAVVKYCFDLRKADWPGNKTLQISATNQSISFHKD